MYKAIIFDFSRVLLFPKDSNYTGTLNSLNQKLNDEFGIDYDFFSYFYLNKELIHLIKDLCPASTLFIFTTDIIQDRPEIREEIDSFITEIYRANELGVNKNTPDAYKVLLNEVGLRPEEALFIDDTVENIEAAKQAGLSTLVYKDNLQVEADLRGLLR